MKGLTSIELAILLAIIIVIAVAVGWYMYTTFVASTTSQGRLAVSSAQITSTGSLTLTVYNPGPVDVTIQAIYVNGQSCDGGSGSSGVTVSVGKTTSVTATCQNGLTPGTTVSGYVVLSSGATFPFTAVVVQGSQNQGSQNQGSQNQGSQNQGS
jgi:Flp pilus assembly protein TadG